MEMHMLDTPTEMLFLGIKNGENTTALQAHLQAGANINGKNHAGYTPLIHVFRSKSNEEIALFLIEHGADNSPEIMSGWTPMHYAARIGWMKVIESLAKKGADLNSLCRYGNVPAILYAANLGKREVVELLISLGADVNRCSSNKWTVLHYAAGFGWLDVVKSLLKKNVDINAETILGETPLFLVLGNLEMFQVLLEAGADLRIKNKFNKSPLDVFVKSSDVASIKFCVENGVVIDSIDYQNMVKEPLVTEGILQDIEVCSESILNSFNCINLPALYQIPYFVNNLPHFEKMKIGHSSYIKQTIKQSVSLKKQAKGHYDFSGTPIVLKMLCVSSLLKYYRDAHN